MFAIGNLFKRQIECVSNAIVKIKNKPYSNNLIRRLLCLIHEV